MWLTCFGGVFPMVLRRTPLQAFKKCFTIAVQVKTTSPTHGDSQLQFTNKLDGLMNVVSTLMELQRYLLSHFCMQGYLLSYFCKKFVYLCWPYLGVVVCLVMIHLACCYVWFWSLMQNHSFISTLGFGWLAAACVQQQRIWLVWVKTECFGLLRKGPGSVLLHDTVCGDGITLLHIT